MIASAIINHLAVIHKRWKNQFWYIWIGPLCLGFPLTETQKLMRFRSNLPGFQGNTPSSALFLYLAFSVHQNEKDSLSDYKHYAGL